MSLLENSWGDTLSPNDAYKPGGTLMSPRYNSPTNGAVFDANSPTLGNAKVNVAVAVVEGSKTCPDAVSIPEGVSSERTGAFVSFAN